MALLTPGMRETYDAFCSTYECMLWCLPISFSKLVNIFWQMWHTGTITKLLQLHFQVVHLNKRKWIEASTYPHFTMIGQSLGSVYLAWEALTNFTPQFYFDTSGYAFTYPLARLFGCKVISYTHYPTISSDMVGRVKQRSSMYNNNSRIAGRYA
jgi:hypothetical protein